MHISEIVISALKIQPQQHIIPLQKSPTLQSQRKRILNRYVNRELIKMFCLSHQQQQLTSSDPEMFNHQIHILNEDFQRTLVFMFYFQLTYELTWITDLIKTSLTWHHPPRHPLYMYALQVPQSRACTFNGNNSHCRCAEFWFFFLFPGVHWN